MVRHRQTFSLKLVSRSGWVVCFPFVATVVPFGSESRTHCHLKINSSIHPLYHFAVIVVELYLLQIVAMFSLAQFSCHFTKRYSLLIDSHFSANMVVALRPPLKLNFGWLIFCERVPHLVEHYMPLSNHTPRPEDVTVVQTNFWSEIYSHFQMISKFCFSSCTRHIHISGEADVFHSWVIQHRFDQIFMHRFHL